MPKINYLEILKKSWQITWQNKHLWWFGFFVALSGWGGALNYNAGESQSLEKFSGQEIIDFASTHATLIISAATLALLILILFLILGIISRGALIASAEKIITQKESNFRSGFADGKKYFWKILWLGLSVSLLTILTLCVLIAPVAFFFYQKSYVIGFILLILALAIIIPILFIAAFLRIYGYLYAVLGNLSVGDALENAYELLRQNVLASIFICLIFFAINIVFGLLLIGLLMPVTLVFLAIGFALSLVFQKIGVALAIAIFTLIMLPIIMWLKSLYEVFAQIFLVLFFHEIAKPKVEEKIAEPVAEEKPLPAPDIA